MAIVEADLRTFSFDPVDVVLTPRDAILYALGLGLGENPEDSAQLRYVYEDGLSVLPTIPVVLGSPGAWFAKAGINFAKIVHGSQSLTLHNAVPLERAMTAQSRVIGVYDKGADKGAIVDVERTLSTRDGTLIATTISSYFCRGDGGFGGRDDKPRDTWTRPDRTPDQTIRIVTLPQQALLYRLNGDTNPLHADPALARKLGFERPILHGLCTFGLAGRAVDTAFPGQIVKIEARMGKPVYPGDTLLVDLWREGDEIQFEISEPVRDTVVLTYGRASLGGVA